MNKTKGVVYNVRGLKAKTREVLNHAAQGTKVYIIRYDEIYKLTSYGKANGKIKLKDL